MYFIIAHIWGRTPAALLSCPQWTTGRRPYTTAPLAGPSQTGGASDERRENVNNMPELSSETETEAGSSDRQQRDRGTASSRNVVSLISQLADDNLTLVRVGGSLCGLLVHVGGTWMCIMDHFRAFLHLIVLYLVYKKVSWIWTFIPFVPYGVKWTSYQASPVVPPHSLSWWPPWVTITPVKVFLSGVTAGTTWSSCLSAL